MSEAVYILCAVTSLLCSGLLLRGYWGSGARLLLWSGLCFAGLTVENVMLFVDQVIYPDVNLSAVRQSIGIAAMGLLLFGLVWDAT